jgi:hypothetical protein
MDYAAILHAATQDEGLYRRHNTRFTWISDSSKYRQQTQIDSCGQQVQTSKYANEAKAAEAKPQHGKQF